MLVSMSFSAESPPAGWYADPAGSGGERYWDGGNWSHVTRPAGGMGGAAPQQQSAPLGQGATYAPGTSQGQGAPYGQADPYGQAGYGAQVPRQPVLAGFWWRVLAALLDSAIVAIPFGLVVSVVARGPVAALGLWWEEVISRAMQGDVTQPPIPDGAITTITVVIAVMWIIYRTVLVALRGATLGQLIVGLRVLPDGSPLETIPSWKTSGVRALAAVVLQQIPLVGFADVLAMLFNAKKQTVHDMIARTVVIKK